MTTGQKNLYWGLNDVILQIEKMSSRTIVYNMFLPFLPFFGILLKNHLSTIFATTETGMFFGWYLECTSITVFLLGRHFGCRPQDPTLDISPNFVKKKRKKKHLPPLLRFQLLRVNRVYQWLLRVTKGYQGLTQVNSG